VEAAVGHAEGGADGKGSDLQDNQAPNGRPCYHGGYPWGKRVHTQARAHTTITPSQPQTTATPTTSPGRSSRGSSGATAGSAGVESDTDPSPPARMEARGDGAALTGLLPRVEGEATA